MLNAVRSILILEGVNPESHEGAMTLLSLRFVKTGLLPVDLTKQFKKLLSRRSDVDYGDFDSIDEWDTRDSLESAERMIANIDTVRVTLIRELTQ